MDEWEAEPNEKDWKHKKLRCRIIRCPRSKHLCGYVEIPKGHILYKTEYNQTAPKALKAKEKKVLEGTIGKRGPIDIFCLDPYNMQAGFLFDVHGGITFSGKLKGKRGFWYGFDCAHCDDLSPGYDVGFVNGVYRNMEYVIN